MSSLRCRCCYCYCYGYYYGYCWARQEKEKERERELCHQDHDHDRYHDIDLYEATTCELMRAFLGEVPEASKHKLVSLFGFIIIIMSRRAKEGHWVWTRKHTGRVPYHQFFFLFHGGQIKEHGTPYHPPIVVRMDGGVDGYLLG